MHPELHLGWFTLPSYTTLFVGAVAIAWSFYLVRTTRLGYDWPRVLFGLAWCFPIGVLGAQGLAFTVEHLASDAAITDPGMSVLGAIVACTLYGMWVVPRLFDEAPWRLLDAGAFGLPLCMLVGRFACLAHGCCMGAPAEEGLFGELFAVQLEQFAAGSPVRQLYAGAPTSLLLWNTPLLLAMQSVISLLLVEGMYARRPPPGVTAAFALTLYALGRLIIEQTRGGTWVAANASNPWAVSTVVLLGASLVLLFWRARSGGSSSTV